MRVLRPEYRPCLNGDISESYEAFGNSLTGITVVIRCMRWLVMPDCRLAEFEIYWGSCLLALQPLCVKVAYIMTQGLETVI